LDTTNCFSVVGPLCQPHNGPDPGHGGFVRRATLGKLGAFGSSSTRGLSGWSLAIALPGTSRSYPLSTAGFGLPRRLLIQRTGQSRTSGRSVRSTMAGKKNPAEQSAAEGKILEAWLAGFDLDWEHGLLERRVRGLQRLPLGPTWQVPALIEMVKIDLKHQW